MSHWHYADGERQVGPVDSSALEAAISAGRINRSTPVWREGMTDWLPAGEIADLAPLLPAEPPPLRRTFPDPVAPPPRLPAASSPPAATAVPAIWSPGAAVAWSLPLSAAFGALIHAKNWKSLGEDSQASKSMWWAYLAVAALVFLLAAIYFTRSAPVLTCMAVPMQPVVLVAWYVTSARAQSAFVRERFGDRLPGKSWGAPILLAAVLWIVYVLAALACIAKVGAESSGAAAS